MTIFRSMDEFTYPSCVAALGTFDGVHLGHAALIRQAVALGKRYGVPSAALTFDRHPMTLTHPDKAPKALISEAEKARLFEGLGLDAMIVEPFTPEFAALTPDEYIKAVAAALHPRVLIVGYDHRFGRGGAGDASLLERLAPEYGYEAVIVPPVCVDGAPVSSTRIRALLDAGDTAEAARLLGHDL